MIPKTIHYCWFGRGTKDDMTLKCIQSWKKFCPDYEIIEWNEDNFDYLQCSYTREAYESGKWAFVSDYARFWILYKYGGIYFDTDVELIKPIEKVRNAGNFFAFEQRSLDGKNQFLVAPGLGMGAEKEHEIYKKMLSMYSTLHFLDDNGFENKKTVVLYITEILQQYGLIQSPKPAEDIVYIEGIRIYPWDYFCPMSYQNGEITITENTYTIHHYGGSWKTTDEKNMKKIYDNIKFIFGKEVGTLIARMICFPYRVYIKGKSVGICKLVKMLFKKGYMKCVK